MFTPTIVLGLRAFCPIISPCETYSPFLKSSPPPLIPKSMLSIVFVGLKTKVSFSLKSALIPTENLLKLAAAVALFITIIKPSSGISTTSLGPAIFVITLFDTTILESVEYVASSCLLLVIVVLSKYTGFEKSVILFLAPIARETPPAP